MMVLYLKILSVTDGDYMKTCFMFGHSNTPDILAQLIETMEYCYEELGVRRFVVGSRGNFDRLMAWRGIRSLKEKHGDLLCQQVIAYHPALNRNEIRDVSPYVDGTYYPMGAERVPNAVAIRRVNELMVQEADVVLCYVRHPGNARNLLEYAQRKKKICINLAP